MFRKPATLMRTLPGFIGMMIALPWLTCAQATEPLRAQADMGPSSGSQASGSVKLVAAARGVHLEVEIHGLSPGVHGFHVHEVGDCSAPDASSAKGHFNPEKQPHGSHAGDLPDLEADASGAAHLVVDIPGLSLGDEAGGIAGRALVVHADPDDHHSQPAGNSGKRIACGVIRLQH